jgi:hypothetical protein
MMKAAAFQMNRLLPIFRIVLATLVLPLIGLTTACATLPGDSGLDMRSPGPENGYIPNSIGIVPPGRAYVETSVEAARGPQDQSFRRFPVLVRTGLGENLEARVVVGAYRYDEGATDRESGSGPLSLGAKYRISKGRGTALTPAWGLEVDVVVSGVFDEPNDGSVVSGLALNFDHTLSPSTLLSWNVAVLVPEDSQGDYFAQGFFTAAFAGFVSKNIQLYVDGALNFPSDGPGTDPAALLGCGGYLYLGNRVVIWAAYDFGLTSVSPDGTAKLGISLAF